MDFSGSNEAKEIETLEEFYDRAREFEFDSPSSFVLKDWVFQVRSSASVHRSAHSGDAVRRVLVFMLQRAIVECCAHVRLAGSGLQQRGARGVGPV